MKNRKELIRRIDDMLFYEDSLSLEEKELYANLFTNISEEKRQEICSKSKLFLMDEYVMNISRWMLYLKEFELEEEFELCSKIKKIMAIEEREFKKIFLPLKCHTQALKEHYTALIEFVQETATKQILLNPNTKLMPN